MHKETLFKAASEAGIQDIEMLITKANTTSIEVFDQVVENFKISESKRYTIRGIYEGHLGTCVVEEDSDTNIPFIISMIQQNAMAITCSDEVEIYGEVCDYPQIEHTKNECLNVSVESKIAYLKEIEQRLKESDRRIEQVMGVSYQDIESGAEIANAKGIHAKRLDAYTIISAAVLASEQDDKKSAYDVIAIKNLASFDVTTFCDTLCKKAVSKLQATQVKSGMYPVLIDREAMVLMLRHFVLLFNGENAYKKISLLQGKVNEKIFDEQITIIDDPLQVDGFASAPFDDEGVPCYKKTLVENGICKGYLHNLKSAKLMRKASTGNGFGGSINPTNLYIQNGTHTKEDMMQHMKTGIMICELNGIHAGYNDLTTQFSLQASGYFIENGKIKHPVNLITIAGNLLTLMKDINMVGNDLKFDLSGVGTPSLLFPNMAVSGE